MQIPRRYKTPPIEEALCEFRFKSERDWDLTIPGKVHTKLNEYTGTPRQQMTVGLELAQKKGAPAQVRHSEELDRVQLFTENNKRIVGVGPDVLSIHMLRPYQDAENPEHSGWKEFQPRISVALDAYWEVAEPTGVHRISIRYINKIEIPQGRIEIEDYLKCALPSVQGLPDHLNNFMSRVDYAYENNTRLVLSQGLVDAPLGSIALLLDLEVLWENPDPVAKTEALEKAGDLRELEREAFETVITDNARRLFDAD